MYYSGVGIYFSSVKSGRFCTCHVGDLPLAVLRRSIFLSLFSRHFVVAGIVRAVSVAVHGLQVPVMLLYCEAHGFSPAFGVFKDWCIGLLFFVDSADFAAHPKMLLFSSIG